jgi:Protein of unknown function (DUF3780)
MIKNPIHGFVVCKVQSQVVVWQCENFDRISHVTSVSDRRARVSLPVDRWEKVAPVFEQVAAERFRENRAGRFKLPKSLGTALIPSSLGKELCVLCWASEAARDEEFEKIKRNWNALAPEERWWLYNTTAASCGQAQEVGKGWRRAIHAALAEEGMTL